MLYYDNRKVHTNKNKNKNMLKIRKKKLLSLGIIAVISGLAVIPVISNINQPFDSMAEGSGTLDPIEDSTNEDCLPSCGSGGTVTSDPNANELMGDGGSGSGSSSESGSGSGSSSSTNGTITYILTYDANGGTLPSDLAASGGDAVENSVGQAVFTVSSSRPTRDNYTFLGWGDSADALVPGHYGGDTITLYYNAPVRTLYAVWRSNDDSGSGTGSNTGGSSSTGGSSTSGGSSSTGGSSTSGGSSSTGSSDETSSEGETGSTDTTNDGYESKEEKYTIDSTFQYLEDDELFVVTFSGDANEIEAIYVDGEAVPEDKYEVLSESSVGINVAYLTAYGKGQHEFVIEWEDGVAKTTLLINSDGTIDGAEDDALAVPNTSSLTPDTGSNTNEDNGSVMVLAGVVPAIILIALLAVMNKQKTHRKFD